MANVPLDCMHTSFTCCQFSPNHAHLEIEMGPQADEQSETNHTAKKEDNACTCSSLHIQGTFTYADTHRCMLHNDTMEHDCTVKNIVPGLIVPSDE